MAEKKSALQQAFIDYVQSIQPSQDVQTRTDLEKVRAAMQANGYTPQSNRIDVMLVDRYCK